MVREENPDPEDINSKVEDKIISDEYTTEYNKFLSVDSLNPNSIKPLKFETSDMLNPNLIGFTIFHGRSNTRKYDGV